MEPCQWLKFKELQAENLRNLFHIKCDISDTLILFLKMFLDINELLIVFLTWKSFHSHIYVLVWAEFIHNNL